MTVIAKHQGLSSEVPERLSDEQRAAIAEFYDANSGGGYKAACRAAGLRLKHADAKQLVMGDDELRNAYFASMGIDEKTLFEIISALARNVDGETPHQVRMRSVTWLLNSVHRWHENAEVEHSGEVSFVVESAFAGRGDDGAGQDRAALPR